MKNKNLLNNLNEEECYILQRALVEFICQFGYPNPSEPKYNEIEIKTAEQLLNKIASYCKGG